MLLVAPPTTARADGEVVTDERPFVALTEVPPKALSSEADAQLLDPSDPFKYKVPIPTLALNSVCVFGEASAAVPPEVVVWKSHPAMISCASALTAPIQPAAISATHHFVNPKFELRRIFFIFLVSYFLSPSLDHSDHPHQNGSSTTPVA